MFMAPVQTDPFAVAKIDADQTMALVAQVNRWRKQAGQPLYPLKPGEIPREVVGDVVLLLSSRFALTDAIRADPVGYVREHSNEITTTLARYGDALKLPPAEYGITPKKIPTWLYVLAGGAGLLAAGSVAAFVMKRRRRSLPAAV